MLKEETFDRVAKEYGTSVGVAKIFSIQPLEEVKDEFKDTTSYNEYERGLTLNYIITDSIYEGKYQMLQKKLYELRVIRKTKIKDELKLYKKAYKEINNECNE